VAFRLPRPEDERRSPRSGERQMRRSRGNHLERAVAIPGALVRAQPRGTLRIGSSNDHLHRSLDCILHISYRLIIIAVAWAVTLVMRFPKIGANTRSFLLRAKNSRIPPHQHSLYWGEGAPSLTPVADSAGVFHHPSQRGLSPAPQRPPLTCSMQYGSLPKFLLSSRAPASGGFMAEPVGTCQGSALRFDR
jgi:hypothetical protein